jgi:hypothetical protein
MLFQRRLLWVALVVAFVGAGCADGGDHQDGIVIDATADTIPFDRRLLGTNVPAWLGPELLADESFLGTAVASGMTLARMPGGSWSNAYDWQACEVGDETRCSWTWAARPTDFIDFLQATGAEGMWTLPAGVTAQSAAAAVAFFNGEVGDDRVIGVDRDGVDWGTVERWASLRAEGGNPEPQAIELWEIGNEVYGGTPESGGEECASFGWEEVWTCDGAEYVSGDDDHDGYLAVRSAMRDVDSSIEVGAVGVAGPAEWSKWGNEVIEGAGDDLDFYVVHTYGFDSSPSETQAVERPLDLWPDVVASVREQLESSIPIAITEYNLVSFEAGDTEQSMIRAMNALYIADSIGQLAVGGVTIANQWNLANGTTPSGTDYGMISVDDGTTFPQYEALRLWSRARAGVLPPVVQGSLRVYPTIDDSGLAMVIVNGSDEEASRAMTMDGVPVAGRAVLTSASADDLSAEVMTTNVVDIPVTGGRLPVELPPYSVSVLEVTFP